jgi:hypothetical protein
MVKPDGHVQLKLPSVFEQLNEQCGWRESLHSSKSNLTNNYLLYKKKGNEKITLALLHVSL